MLSARVQTRQLYSNCKDSVVRMILIPSHRLMPSRGLALGGEICRNAGSGRSESYGQPGISCEAVMCCNSVALVSAPLVCLGGGQASLHTRLAVSSLQYCGPVEGQTFGTFSAPLASSAGTG